MRILIFNACHVCVLIMLCLTADSFASECRPWQPEDKNNTDLVIGEVLVKANDIFDLNNPAENHKVHRIANKLHIQTREEVIRRQLLFTQGHYFETRLLDETARLLRANTYIKDATVTPVKICGNSVDIEVRTTDNWTLTPGISYSHSGGKSSSGAEIEEHNLLGYGKELTFSYKNNVDRSNSLVKYHDPQFMGARNILSVAAQDNTDGEYYGVNYTLPFFELDSRKSFGLRTYTDRRRISIYNNGAVSYKLGQKTDKIEVFTGWSDGIDSSGSIPENKNGKTVKRFRLGWMRESSNFFTVDGPSSAPDFRRLSYPWVEYEYLQEEFIQKSNLRSMGVVEDISLGHHFVARFGLPGKVFGSSDDYLNFSAAYSKGYLPSSNQLVLMNLSADTFAGNGPMDGERLKAKGEWHIFQSNQDNFLFSSELYIATNLQGEEQILLGGDSGLRGYPLRYQSGNKVFLVTAEQRHFFDWYPYQLLRVGAAIFADTGSAWGEGNKMDMLSDVGFGLRLVSTRSTGTNIIHIDFAFPLDAKGNIDNFQILVGTKQSL